MPNAQDTSTFRSVHTQYCNLGDSLLYLNVTPQTYGITELQKTRGTEEDFTKNNEYSPIRMVMVSHVDVC